jgi:hypothetical protein
MSADAARYLVAAAGFSAVTAATTTASVAAATATAAMTAAFALRTGFIHIQGPAANFVAVDCGNGPVALRVIVHLNEGKASGLACIAVGNYTDTVDRAVGFKQRTDGLLVGVKAKISHKNILHSVSAFWI